MGDLVIKVKRRDFWIAFSVILVFISIGFTYAYNSVPSDPSVMGHDANEIDVDLGTWGVHNLTGALNILLSLKSARYRPVAPTVWELDAHLSDVTDGKARATCADKHSLTVGCNVWCLDNVPGYNTGFAGAWNCGPTEPNAWKIACKCIQ